MIEAINPATLETTSRIRLPGNVESIAADSSGRMLFVALTLRTDQNGCCALYALDLPALRLTFLTEPALGATATIDRVLAQRGNVGIEVFNAHTLARMPALKAPGVYRMQPSSDGHWLFGTTTFPSPSLDLFDLPQGNLVWRRAFENGQYLQGAWIGEHYYLLSADRAGHRELWSVNRDNPDLMERIPVALPNDPLPDCEPIVQTILAAGERLVIHEEFGHKLDRRRSCATAPGGFVVVDPKTGATTDRLAAAEHFRQMAASADGRYLYGLDVDDLQWKQVRIVKLDAASGATVGTKTLDSDVWFLNSGTIPREMEGNLDLTARKRELRHKAFTSQESALKWLRRCVLQRWFRRQGDGHA